MNSPRRKSKFGLLTEHQPPAGGFFLVLSKDNQESNSTAERMSLGLLSIYFCVTARLRCPAKSINTRTDTPISLSFVMNVRLELWDLAPTIPAPLYM